VVKSTTGIPGSIIAGIAFFVLAAFISASWAQFALTPTAVHGGPNDFVFGASKANWARFGLGVVEPHGPCDPRRPVCRSRPPRVLQR
jgi:hypothetical protein